MQKKTSRTTPGLYYYRGRYWSAMVWSKLNRQPFAKDIPQSGEEKASAGGETGSCPIDAPEQAGAPTAATSL